MHIGKRRKERTCDVILTLYHDIMTRNFVQHCFKQNKLKPRNEIITLSCMKLFANCEKYKLCERNAACQKYLHHFPQWHNGPLHVLERYVRSTFGEQVRVEVELGDKTTFGPTFQRDSQQNVTKIDEICLSYSTVTLMRDLG